MMSTGFVITYHNIFHRFIILIINLYIGDVGLQLRTMLFLVLYWFPMGW